MHPTTASWKCTAPCFLTRRFEEASSNSQDRRHDPRQMILNGQEGVAAGVCAALEPADAIITNHRSHGHLLAKGADPNTPVAEIFGRATGCNRGKSGNPALGRARGQRALHVHRGRRRAAHCRRLRLAQQYRDEQAVTVCFIGDGCRRGLVPRGPQPGRPVAAAGAGRPGEQPVRWSPAVRGAHLGRARRHRAAAMGGRWWTATTPRCTRSRPRHGRAPWPAADRP